MLAAALMVTIRVYDIYGLSPAARQEALAVAARTLEHAGVQAAIVDCSGVAAAVPCKTGLADGELILRIHRQPKDGLHVLGEAFVRGVVDDFNQRVVRVHRVRVHPGTVQDR